MEAIVAEKDVDHPCIAKHIILVVRNGIPGERIKRALMLDRIDLRNKDHFLMAVWAVWMLWSLYPVWLAPELGSDAGGLWNIEFDGALAIGNAKKLNSDLGENAHMSRPNECDEVTASKMSPDPVGREHPPASGRDERFAGG